MGKYSKNIPNLTITFGDLKTLDFYKIPLKLKTVGSNSEIFLPFVASEGTESLLVPRTRETDFTKGFGNESLPTTRWPRAAASGSSSGLEFWANFYHKTGNFYTYNTKLKQNILDTLDFTTYPLLSTTGLRARPLLRSRQWQFLVILFKSKLLSNTQTPLLVKSHVRETKHEAAFKHLTNSLATMKGHCHPLSAARPIGQYSCLRSQSGQRVVGNDTSGTNLIHFRKYILWF
jgi:hypothetical protein